MKNAESMQAQRPREEAHSRSDGPGPGAGSTTIARQWAEFIQTTDYPALPEHIVESAKSRVLDCLATALEAQGLPVPSVAMKFVGNSVGPATVIGRPGTLASIDAAFVNATLINGCTHDDFLYKSHPGAVVLPAALAVAEELGRSGQELISSLVVGYELVARAYLGGPTMLPHFRATGVAGAIGAGAAAGKMLRLGNAELVNALGCAAMFASGFGEGFKTGTMDVKLNVGWASRSGLSAAQLAACGATSSPWAFEGESGFFQAHARSTRSVADALEGLGERFLIEDTVYKELPVCIFVQTPVHLALELMEKENLDPERIEQVTIRAPEATLTNPGYKNIAPFNTQLKARISARFTTAAALLGRPVDTYDFYSQTEDAAVLALVDKIHLLDPDPDQDGRVDIDVLCNGRHYRASGKEMDTLRPGMAKSIAKFRRLTRNYPDQWVERLLKTVLDLDQIDRISDFTAQLRKA